MSASTVDTGTLELVDLEEIFDKADECEVGDGRPAQWKLVASCGHVADVCGYHKTVEITRFKREFPNTFCHVNRDVHVTSLEAGPL